MNHCMRCARTLSAVLSVLLLLSACAGPPPPRSAAAPPLLSTSGGPPPSPPPLLRPDHPGAYTVVPGDTLWEIAGRFLEAPWRWPEIWRLNPAIRNPHLIYPGDVLEVFYEDGQPRLRVATGDAPAPAARTPDGRPLIKLSPQVRVEALNRPIPTVPLEAIQPFIDGSRIVDPADWQAAPYVIGTDGERVTFAVRDRLYARGLGPDQQRWQVFHAGAEFTDPETGEFLGFQAIHAGDAVLEREGDPATLRVVRSLREIVPGDRLLPEADQEAVYRFVPHPPPPDTRGRILAVPDGVSLIGRYRTVVLNLGEADGLEPGHVLAVHDDGGTATDPVDGSTVRLPDQRAGLLLVYRVFDRASFALVTEAVRTIRVADRVSGPELRF